MPPGTYVFGSADDAIKVVKADTPPLAMLTPPSLTGPLRIGGEAAISPGTFTAGLASRMSSSIRTRALTW